MRGDLIAGIVGAMTGMVIAGYLAVYKPMMRNNIAERGCPWLECQLHQR